MKKNQTDFLKLCLADALIKKMRVQAYDTININEICELAGVGRTTFYRHFNNKGNVEDLLKFKLLYEWESYKVKRAEEVSADRNFAFLNFVYENKSLFSLLERSGIINIALCLAESLGAEDYDDDKGEGYMKSFFTYGIFGIVYRWIKNGFDEAPDLIRIHIAESIMKNFVDTKA